MSLGLNLNLWGQQVGRRPPAYVGGKTGIATSAPGRTVSLTDLTGGIASAPASGDIILIAFGVGSAIVLNLAIDTAGYIEIADLYANDTVDANFAVFRKLATNDTQVVINSSVNVTTSQGCVYAIQVWRNIDAVTPLDVAATTATGINTGRPDCPAITPVSSGSIIVAAGLGTNFGTTLAVLTSSDLDGFQSVAAGTSNNSVVGMGYKAWAGGPFDPAQFGGGSTDTGSSWAAVTLALRPA